MRHGLSALFMLLCLGACESPEDERMTGSPGMGSVTSVVVPETTPSSADGLAASSSQAPDQCRADIGEEAAQALAGRCRMVSPATHPPCHPDNSCAMIQGEIDRSCAMWEKDKSQPLPAECKG